MGEPKIDSPLERYVLCLDDDPEFLKSLEVFLPDAINAGRTDGLWYRFVFLQDPAETLEVLRDLAGEGSSVALLISDQQMPSMKGTELLNEARRITPCSLRVLLTGHAGIEAAITAINERLLDRYLTKPIEDAHDFTLNVRQLLQRFEMERVIESQASALRGLYEFANTINAMNQLDGMVEYVADFTRTALDSTEVCVVAGDGRASRHCVAIHRDGGTHPASDSAEPETLARDLRSGLGSLLKGACEVPATLREALQRHGVVVAATAACAHLVSGHSCLGFIVAGRQSNRTLPEQERRTLEYIADTASIAIHKHLTWYELQNAYRVTKEQSVSLEEANRKLTTLDEMKTEFLRFISHELRTPLSYMSAIGILEGPIDPAEQVEMAAIIRKGYNRLEQFINKGLDYLDWCGASHADSTDITDFRPLLRNAVEWLTKSSDRKIDLELVTPDHPCAAAMTWEWAEEVVRILLENAVKFSGDQPWVRVELRSSPDLVTLEIADRGRGFPPEIAGDIFRPFTVMDTMHHREGTALNLARASAMIEAHGGRIRAESPGKGQGATFTIELPAAQPPAAQPPAAAGVPRAGDAGDSENGARRGRRAA